MFYPREGKEGRIKEQKRYGNEYHILIYIIKYLYQYKVYFTNTLK